MFRVVSPVLRCQELLSRATEAAQSERAAAARLSEELRWGDLIGFSHRLLSSSFLWFIFRIL